MPPPPLARGGTQPSVLLLLHRAAATEGDAWGGGDALDEWKEVYLFGGGVASNGLRKRKKASPVANGKMMKGVLGEGPEVEY